MDSYIEFLGVAIVLALLALLSLIYFFFLRERTHDPHVTAKSGFAFRSYARFIILLMLPGLCIQLYLSTASSAIHRALMPIHFGPFYTLIGIAAPLLISTFILYPITVYFALRVLLL